MKQKLRTKSIKYYKSVNICCLVQFSKKERMSMLRANN